MNIQCIENKLDSTISIIDPKGKISSYTYKFTGLHYNGGKIKKEFNVENFVDGKVTYSDFKSGDRVIIGKKNLPNGFYEAEVAIFDEDVYKIHLPQKGMTKPKGFVKKDVPSTFFPDSWDEEKIKKEIAWAYDNMKPKVVVEKGVNKIYYGGKMSDGTNLEFQINPDGSIKSAFPNFQDKFIKLFK